MIIFICILIFVALAARILISLVWLSENKSKSTWAKRPCCKECKGCSYRENYNGVFDTSGVCPSCGSIAGFEEKVCRMQIIPKRLLGVGWVQR